MPAYCNLSLQFLRKDITADFMNNFYEHLLKCGLKIKSGYWFHENDTIEETIKANQKLIEENFVLGYDQHCKYDYRQTVFEYGEFSEVRGFWMNKIPNEKGFVYEIIYPESEIIESDNSRLIFNKKNIVLLSELAEKLWEFPFIVSIQTGTEMECNGIPLDNEKGMLLPGILPFCLINERRGFEIPQNYTITNISRNGILIFDEEKYQDDYKQDL